jgi:multidrug resistance efflux pump
MVVIILGVYFGFVYLVFFRFRLLPLNFLTKTIIVVLGVFIFLTLVTELRIKTPASAQATVTTYIVDIAPQVNGRIDQVLVERNQVVEEGTVLFTIDPTLYQSRVDALEASIALTRLRAQQFEELAEADAASRFQLQQTQAELKQLEANLVGARFDLANTDVRAPSRGLVPRLFLEPGVQVSPGRSVMTFMNTEETFVIGLFQQVALQQVKVGDKALVSFPALPGRLFESEVVIIPSAIGEGQQMVTGSLPRASSYQGTRLYPIAVALPEDFPEDIKHIGMASVVYIHTENAGPISAVARIIQWIGASIAVLV